MKIRREEGDQTGFQNISIESRIKSLTVQIVLMCISLGLYLNKGGVLLGLCLGYFCVNACFILLVILLLASNSKRKQKIPETKTVTPEEPAVVKKEEAPKPGPSVKKQELNFQLSFKKKKKSIAPPKQIVLKKYDEYRDEFQLNHQMKKDFRVWVLKNVLMPFIAEQDTQQNRAGTRTRKTLSGSEIKNIKIMGNNGLMCYDKSNEEHGRALFKMLYNYFNDKIPGDSSFYTNPMDEFVFDDISKVKISKYGLLVEDTESLVEGKKTFSVYFIDKNVLYDTSGDVLLSFLMLLVFANMHDGECLGALYLRNIPFLPKCPVYAEE